MIINTPIRLTVKGNDVPNLTLIDLPGITKLNKDGQKSVSEDIEKLVLEYIEKENTIILAITPANADIVSSDGLAFARRVDPNRDRTFGVITKIDIMDKGTNACNYLEGKSIKLKHGYVGVKCRSQEDNNKGKSVIDALREEKEFFETHEDYKKIAENQGIPVLSRKLSQLLEKHIIRHLPKIEELIEKNLQESYKVYEEIGKEEDCETDSDALNLIINSIDTFKDDFKYIVYKASRYEKDLENSSYTGGSKIYKLFQNFGIYGIDNVDPLKSLSDELIFKELRISYGIEPGLFIPEEA